MNAIAESDSQKKKIVKTVAIIVVIMITILVLFIHKITTPRYLSNIELKINGFVLFDNPISISEKVSKKIEANQWALLVRTKNQKEIFESFVSAFNQKLPNHIAIVENNITEDSLSSGILLVNPSAEFLGYFKAPYDEHKFILTLASVVTHRD